MASKQRGEDDYMRLQFIDDLPANKRGQYDPETEARMKTSSTIRSETAGCNALADDARTDDMVIVQMEPPEDDPFKLAGRQRPTSSDDASSQETGYTVMIQKAPPADDLDAVLFDFTIRKRTTPQNDASIRETNAFASHYHPVVITKHTEDSVPDDQRTVYERFQATRHLFGSFNTEPALPDPYPQNIRRLSKHDPEKEARMNTRPGKSTFTSGQIPPLQPTSALVDAVSGTSAIFTPRLACTAGADFDAALFPTDPSFDHLALPCSGPRDPVDHIIMSTREADSSPASSNSDMVAPFHRDDVKKTQSLCEPSPKKELHTMDDANRKAIATLVNDGELAFMNAVFTGDDGKHRSYSDMRERYG